MSEKLLHCSEVRTPVEQVARERMSENMRRYAVGTDGGFASDVLEVLRKPLSRHVPGCRPRRKKPFRIIEPACDVKKPVERIARRSIERDEPFAAAFALDREDTLVAT